MTAAGFLPVTFINNQLMFLFGLESPSEDTAKGYSDFVGGVDKNENENSEKGIYTSGLRECSEEFSGFLGGPKEVHQLVKKNGGYMKYTHDNGGSNYHIHMFRLDYDEKLLQYYNASHKYLYEKLDHTLLKKTKVFEKIKIKWFTVDMMKKEINTFRSFYRDIVRELIIQAPDIELFIRKTIKIKNRKTKKKHFRT